MRMVSCVLILAAFAHTGRRHPGARLRRDRDQPRARGARQRPRRGGEEGRRRALEAVRRVLGLVVRPVLRIASRLALHGPGSWRALTVSTRAVTPGACCIEANSR